MTLDMVFMLIADPKDLRTRRGRSPLELGIGLHKGRTADGKPITGRVVGVSKARQAMQAAAAARAAAAAKKPSRREQRAAKRGRK